MPEKNKPYEQTIERKERLSGSGRETKSKEETLMFKKIKISTELYTIVFGIALATTLIVLFTIIQNKHVSKEYETVIGKYDVANTNTSNLNSHFNEMTLAVSDMFNNGEINAENYQNSQTIVTEIRTEIEPLFKSVHENLADVDSEIADNIKKLETLSQQQADLIDEVFDLLKKGDAQGAITKYTQELRALNTEVNTLTTVISNAASDLSVHMAKKVNASRIARETIIVIIAVVVVLVAIFSGIYLVRDIRIPLNETIEVMRKISIGDLNVSIEKHKENEFGQLADILTELIRRERAVSQYANSLSKGDLCIEVHPANSTDILGNSLKNLVEGNNLMLTNIRQAAQQVGIGSDQVASASQALAQGSTEQASSLQQVTASITDVTEKTRINAQNATKVNELMFATKNNAARGNDEMSLTIDAMGAINEASENIFKIIKTIDDIAFQTNILALNAAVEAARAGEHGKGFAVVAEEVRNLAAKSAEAASETEKMIEDAIQKVQHGSTLASSTAGMLEEIISAIDNIVGLMQEITNASNDQATAISQIDQAIIQVSQVVQTNSATSEQCAAASEELSGQSRNLENLLSKYKLRDLAGSSLGIETPHLKTEPSFTASTPQPIPTLPHSTSTFKNSPTETTNEQIISLEDSSFGKY